MNKDIENAIQKLTVPEADSHKGQNGKLLLIGGSKLFHAASLWSLTVASRIVDLVHYCSIPENNDIVANAKQEFRNGIIVAREDIEDYIKEDDVVLVGPGMTRDEETKILTNSLLKKYPEKQWVIDAGALQMVDPAQIPKNAILTPHEGEFEILLSKLETRNSTLPAGRQEFEINAQSASRRTKIQIVKALAEKLGCIILLKGEVDIASNGKEVVEISGGNVGMTKGGTGDVLAGLIAALACTSDPWASVIAGSYINKKAGDELAKTVGIYFNVTDLAGQIPKTMKEILQRG